MVKKYSNFILQLESAAAVALSESAIKSLVKKSERSNIPIDILEKVYIRGYSIWNESFNQTAEQFAFDRVNSFIAGGFALALDQDLINIEEKFGKEYMKGGRTFLKLKRAKEKAAKNPPKNMSKDQVDDLVKQFLNKGGKVKTEELEEGKRGLWDNIHAKRKRIKGGSGEKMRKPGSEGAPTDAAIKASQNEESDPCWKGYNQIGMKMKGGKKVPNCVPVKEDENLDKVNQITKDLKSITNKDKKLPHVDDGAPEMFKIGKKPIKENEEARSKDMNDPASRFVGSDELVNIYKQQTPGQSSTTKTIKKVVKEAIEESNLRAKHKNPSGGLTQAGRDYYNRTAGANLQAPVTTKPSKLKKGSKAANRRKSFCARMGGMKKRLTSAKTANDPDSRINKSLRKWNC